MNDSTEFYNGDCIQMEPIKGTLSTGNAELLITNVCSKQPVRVCQNVSFIVDLHMLDDPLDIRADINGVWRCKGSPIP